MEDVLFLNKGTKILVKGKPSLELRLGDSMNQETQRSHGCCCTKGCSRSHAGRRVAVRGARGLVSGGSRIDTLNETSETAVDSQVGSGNTYLEPSGGTVDTHGFTDITVARLEDTIIIVSGHVPGALDERYQAPPKSKQYSQIAPQEGIRTPITS